MCSPDPYRLPKPKPSSSNFPTKDWYSRSGEGPEQHGEGMAYSWGAKDSISEFNSLVTNCIPPAYSVNKVIVNGKVVKNFTTTVSSSYAGNISEDGKCEIVTGGKKQYVGLKDYESDRLPQFSRSDWAGSDCMGFVVHALSAPPINASINYPEFCFDGKEDCKDKRTIGGEYALSMVTASQFTSAKGVFTDNAYKWIDAKNLNKLHKGDVVFYPGHVAIVYSEKNEGVYKILHAFGAECFGERQADGKCKPGKFARQVMITNNTAPCGANGETGSGRIMLWK